MGLRVAAHIETAANFRLALNSGVDLIGHLPAAWQIGAKTYSLTAAAVETNS
jgi:hypothetical protein